MNKSVTKGSLLSPYSIQPKISQSPSLHFHKTHSAKSIDLSEGVQMNRSYTGSSGKFMSPGFSTGIQELSSEINDVYEFRKKCFDKIRGLETLVDRNRTTYENEINYMQEYINLLKRKVGKGRSGIESVGFEVGCEECRMKNRENLNLADEIEKKNDRNKKLEAENNMLRTDNFNKRQEIALLSKEVQGQADVKELFEIISELEEKKNIFEAQVFNLQIENKKLEARIKEKDGKGIEKENFIGLKNNLMKIVEENILRWEQRFETEIGKADEIEKEAERLKSLADKLQREVKQQQSLRGSQELGIISSVRFKEITEENTLLTEQVDRLTEENRDLLNKLRNINKKTESSTEAFNKLKIDHESLSHSVLKLETENSIYIETFNELKSVILMISGSGPSTKSLPINQSKSLEEDLEWIINKINSLNDELKLSQESCRDLEAEQLKAHKALHDIAQENDNLRNHIKELDNYTNESEIITENHNKEVKRLRNENFELKDNLKKSNRKHEALSVEKMKLEDEVARLSIETSRKDESIQKLSKASKYDEGIDAIIENQKKRLEEAKNYIESLENKLEEERKANEPNYVIERLKLQLYDKIEELERNSKQNQDLLDRKEQEMRDLKIKLEDLANLKAAEVEKLKNKFDQQARYQSHEFEALSDKKKQKLADKAEELELINEKLRCQLNRKSEEIERLQELLQDTLSGIIEQDSKPYHFRESSKGSEDKLTLEKLDKLSTEISSGFEEKSALKYLEIIREFSEKLKKLLHSNDMLEKNNSGLIEELDILNSELDAIRKSLQDSQKDNKSLRDLLEETEKRSLLNKEMLNSAAKEHEAITKKLHHQISIKNQELHRLQDILQKSIDGIISSNRQKSPTEKRENSLNLSERPVEFTEESFNEKYTQIIVELTEKVHSSLEAIEKLEEIVKEDQIKIDYLSAELKKQKNLKEEAVNYEKNIREDLEGKLEKSIEQFNQLQDDFDKLLIDYNMLINDFDKVPGEYEDTPLRDEKISALAKPKKSNLLRAQKDQTRAFNPDEHPNKNIVSSRSPNKTQIGVSKYPRAEVGNDSSSSLRTKPEADHEDLQEALLQSLNDFENLKNSYRALEEEFERLQEEKKEIINKLYDTQDKNHSLQAAIEDLQGKLKDSSRFNESASVHKSDLSSTDKETNIAAKLKYQNDLISELENKNTELESRFNRIRNKNNLLETNTKKYAENVEKTFKDVNKKLIIIEKHITMKEEKIQAIYNDYVKFKTKYIANFQEKTRTIIQGLFEAKGTFDKDPLGFKAASQDPSLDKDDIINLLKQRIDYLQDKIDSLVKSNYVTKEIIENISDKAHDAIEMIKID